MIILLTARPRVSLSEGAVASVQARLPAPKSFQLALSFSWQVFCHPVAQSFQLALSFSWQVFCHPVAQSTGSRGAGMPFYVYILASKRNGTLYVESTSNLMKRVWEHKNKVLEGFTSKYSVTNLVYFEQFEDAYGMVRRERRIKEWQRAWKIRIIEQQNPRWKDLYETIY